MWIPLARITEELPLLLFQIHRPGQVLEAIDGEEFQEGWSGAVCGFAGAFAQYEAHSCQLPERAG